MTKPPVTVDTTTKTQRTQAERVIAKFGGCAELAYALAKVGKPRHYTNVYRWTQPKTVRGGTGGTIPASALPSVLEAAAKYDITLTADDLDPRPR
jgi:hypothetical protein